ncbi:MAG: hypothetical protein AAGH76_06235 [Pseudomonadota bacterium]
MKFRSWSFWLLSPLCSFLIVAALAVLATFVAESGERHISAILLWLMLGWPLVWGLVMFFVDWPDHPKRPLIYMAVTAVLCVAVLAGVDPAPLRP